MKLWAMDLRTLRTPRGLRALGEAPKERKTIAQGKYVFGVVGTSLWTSRRDVRAACSGATPSSASARRIFLPAAATRAGTPQRAISTIALDRDHASAGPALSYLLSPRLDCSAFTLIELLVVFVVIAILAGLLLPALGKTKGKAKAIVCSNNLQKLQLGWLMYAHENNDELPLNHSIEIGGIQQSEPGSWVVGNAQRDTNTTNIEHGTLFRDVGSPLVYRCPSDRTRVKGQPSLPRTRSYSLNVWLRGAITLEDTATGPDMTENSYPENRKKLMSIVTPAATAAFLEDHEQSINDGLFTIGHKRADPTIPDVWYELPTDRHNHGCDFSFTDGHVDHWKWYFPKRFIGHGQPVANKTRDPEQFDLRDLQRLRAALPLAR